VFGKAIFRNALAMFLGDLNQARPNNPGENRTIQDRRPIQNFGYIQTAFGGGFLNYHALEAKLEHRDAAGLYLLNSFTWSRAIDNASGHLEAQSGDHSRVSIRGLRGERGLAGYHQPLNNTTTLLYELPFGKGRRFTSRLPALAEGLLGGWRLTVIKFMSSGTPVDLTYNPSPSSRFPGRRLTGRISLPILCRPRTGAAPSTG